MKRLEEKLYNLIDNLDTDNMANSGLGVHEAIDFVECRFPHDSYGYIVYHNSGRCFVVTFESQEDEEGEEMESHYEFHEDAMNGFDETSIEDAISIIENNGIFNSNIKLQKEMVCTECHALGIENIDCVCSYGKYKTIELEFEVCKCCGSMISDGSPADTEFNENQLKT